MGSNASAPRTTVFENDTPAGVIDISDDVVKRLKAGLQKDKNANAEKADKAAQTVVPEPVAQRPVEPVIPKVVETPPPAPVVQPPPPPVVRRPIEPPPMMMLPTTSAPLAPPPAYIFYGEPSLTSMQVRREKEEELKANDMYWSKRLEQLEASLKQTNQFLEQEYNETITDVKKRFEQTTPKYQTPPCQDLKALVIDCYKANKNETLKCSSIVETFTNCVNLHRISMLAQKNSKK